VVALGLSLLLAASPVMAQPSAAPAPEQKVLALEGDVEGSPQAAQAFREAMAKEIGARPGFQALASPKEPLIDLMFDAECIEPDDECMAKLGAARGASLVLFYEVSGAGGAAEFKARLVEVRTQKAQKQAAAKATAGDAAAASVAEALLGAKPAAKPKMVSLRVRSTPSAAIVKIDGVEAGLTPMEVRRAVGTAKLEVSKEGYETVVREVTLTDKDLDIDLKLNTSPAAAVAAAGASSQGEGEGDDGAVGTPFYETWWFWTVVGVGVAGAGVGIAAAAGAFDSESTPTGDLSFRLGQQPDQDFSLQSQFR
jgi:hypothetical protein